MHLRLGNDLDRRVQEAWRAARLSSGDLTMASFIRRLIWLGLTKLQLEDGVSRSD